MRRGFTLIEITVVLLLVAGVAGISSGMIWTLRESERRTREYTEDIHGLRRAVRAIETDLRADRGDTCRLIDGTLMRGERVLARRIGRFEIERKDGLWIASIGLMPRKESGRARRPVITLRVRPREQVR